MSPALAQDEPSHPEHTILEVNQMTSWLSADGSQMNTDASTNNGWNGTFPKGTVGAVYTQGFVWGGKVHDGRDPVVRVGGSTYATGTDPGRVLRDASGNVTGPDDPTDRAKYHV